MILTEKPKRLYADLLINTKDERARTHVGWAGLQKKSKNKCRQDTENNKR